MKILVKHNIAFNHDMQEYITYLYNNFVKEKITTTPILKGPQTYASLKNKLAQK
jgi:ABC-type histidine transport system ATPase subunit